MAITCMGLLNRVKEKRKQWRDRMAKQENESPYHSESHTAYLTISRWFKLNTYVMSTVRCAGTPANSDLQGSRCYQSRRAGVRHTKLGYVST